MSAEMTTHCKECGKDVAFKSRSKQAYVEQGGMAYALRRRVALCPRCGSELAYGPFDDAAAQALADAVKRGEGLVTRAQIVEFPRRYAIGKRPLSLLLGWGELTYTRLVDGCMPSKEHSDELRRLYDDPAAFARLLEQGRASGVITETAFARSRKAVSEMLGDMPSASFAEFLVADRICMLSDGDITPRALQMLAYYVQGWSSIASDGPLFTEVPVAAPDGPSYARIQSGYPFNKIQEAARRAKSAGAPSSSSAKAKGAGAARRVKDASSSGSSSATMSGADAARRSKGANAPDAPDADSASSGSPGFLSAREERLVDAVYDRYGRFSGSELARMARSEAPWRKARKRADVAEGAPCDEPITLKSMRKFFSKHPDPLL